MVKASTRSRKGNDTTSPSKSRGPRLCRICPGRPACHECEHTKAGREFLQRQRELASTPKSPRAPQRCTVCEGRPLRSQCIHTQSGKAFLRQQEIEQELYNSSQRIQGDPTSDGVESVPRTPQRPHISAQGHTPTTNTTPDDRSTPDSSPSAFRDLASTGTDSVSTTSLSSPSKKSNYVRPTKKNPKYGWVKGVGRGSGDHPIFRHHALPSPIPEQKVASKRFLENINRLIERCEDVSTMTGCWLVLGAQHSSGVGSTIHYTSPRLARDAPEEAGAIINDFHALMTQLLQSRRTEALTLTRQLQEVEDQNKQIAQNNEVLESKLEKMQQIFQNFAQRLGIDAEDLDGFASSSGSTHSKTQ